MAAIAAAWLVLAAPAAAEPRFKRCGAFGFECARVGVPLDRTGALPGRVSLFVKRIRARERPRRGALVVLAGGPGQSATDAFGDDALAVLYSAYRHRDLIVFDQRGTGRSGLLRCRALERANLLEAGAAAGECAARLGPRRASYTSRDSAEDIEALRLALGYKRIALFGTSYGTKVHSATPSPIRRTSSGSCSTPLSRRAGRARCTWRPSRRCRACFARSAGPAVRASRAIPWGTSRRSCDGSGELRCAAAARQQRVRSARTAWP